MMHWHLTEDQLLALRDGRGSDPEHLQHVEDCPQCRQRLVFLRAFKSALSKLEKDEETLPSLARETEPHPDPNELAAYVDDILASEDRIRVQSHLTRCERCMADVMLLHPTRGIDSPVRERPVRERFREHLTRGDYGPGSPRVGRPQLLLGIEDEPGEKVRFRIHGTPDSSGNQGTGRPHPDERIEVTVGSARVTITAHREGEQRFVDVLVRELGRRASRLAANISLERKGKAIASLFTDKGGKASVAVPDYAPFDLRIDGGWEVPIFLRFEP